MTVTADTPPSAVDAHDASVAAYDAHQDKIVAWNKAVTDAEAVRTDLRTAGDGLVGQVPRPVRAAVGAHRRRTSRAASPAPGWSSTPAR